MMKRLLIVLLMMLCLCGAAGAEESRDWSGWSWDTAPEPVQELLPERVCHPEGELREVSPPEFSVARMHGYQGSGEEIRRAARNCHDLLKAYGMVYTLRYEDSVENGGTGWIYQVYLSPELSQKEAFGFFIGDREVMIPYCHVVVSYGPVSSEYQLNIEHSRYFHCAGETETP